MVTRLLPEAMVVNAIVFLFLAQSAAPRTVAESEKLCDQYLLTGKYAEAVAAQEAAMAALNPEDDPRPHLNRLARAYRAANKTTEAETTLNRVLDIYTKAADDAKIAADSDALGSLYLSLKRLPDARAAYLMAFNMRARQLGGESLEVASSYVNMGVVEERDGKMLAARVDYDQALAISERLLGPEDYRITGILDRIGFLLRNQKKYPLAAPIFQRALSIREKTLGPQHADVAPALENLALTYFADARFPEAEPLLQRSLKIWESTSGDTSPQVCQSLDNLGALYSAQDRLAEAEAAYKRSLWLREKADIASLSTLALLYANHNDPRRAEAFFLRALTIAEKGLGGVHDELPDLKEEYATFLDASNRPLEAKKFRKK